MFGQSTCNDQQARKERRLVCDVALQTNIRSMNSTQPMCALYASIYRWAVENFAEPAFRGYAASTPALDALRSFMAYIEKNPGDFKAEEVEQAFLAMDDKDRFKNPIVIFIPGIPELTIAAYDEQQKVVVTRLYVRGKKATP